jgi:hypothetical protein
MNPQFTLGKDTCLTCNYAVETPNGYVCHKNPKTPLIVNQYGRVMILYKYPEIDEKTDWCGEWDKKSK